MVLEARTNTEVDHGIKTLQPDRRHKSRQLPHRMFTLIITRQTHLLHLKQQIKDIRNNLNRVHILRVVIRLLPQEILEVSKAVVAQKLDYLKDQDDEVVF